MGEFDLVERIRRRAATRDDVALGIGDDAAVLRVPAGQELVACVDTLNVDVHFPSDTAPCDIGWKALAVNLSDLAAMGATPAWALLSLSLPQADTGFVDSLLDGLLALARLHEVALVGGDTSRGPLAISITAMGWVPSGAALRRRGAQVGDEIWITGVPGEAAAALQQWRNGGPRDPGLRARLDRPVPRVAAGRALRDLASACIDVSDGLLADLGHVLQASDVGARIDLARLPCPPALSVAIPDAARRAELQLGGGDDYELCFTALPERHEAVIASLAQLDTPCRMIGEIEAGRKLRVLDAAGQRWCGAALGWNHFGEER